jgi:RHH-type proline utilization regulon transcriptional repressor/proline dehydrogenase/delta 1-pyrroline-5-carboxylate dehydrogenase
MGQKQKGLPQEKAPVNEWVNHLTFFLEKLDLSAEKLGLWTASVANYAYWWQRLQQARDPTKLVGQDNFLEYRPRQNITVRVGAKSDPLDILRLAAAALTCNAKVEISFDPEELKHLPFDWLEMIPILGCVKETNFDFLVRVKDGKMERIRLAEEASKELQIAATHSSVHIIDVPLLANGRLELLHFLREVAISIDYHRYGNLGSREGELRKPVH